MRLWVVIQMRSVRGGDGERDEEMTIWERRHHKNLGYL